MKRRARPRVRTLGSRPLAALVAALRRAFSRWSAQSKKRVALGVLVTASAGGVVALALSSCGKPHAQEGTSPGGANLFADPADSRSGGAATTPAKKFELDARGKELLARVKEGDAPDVMRFGEYVGAGGLTELARAPDTRAVALAAMAFTPDLSCVAVLAEAAKDGTDDDAATALDALHTIAARPRLADDLEDFAELEYACTTLLTLATSDAKPERARRATSVLRMLKDRGCDVTSLPASPALPTSTTSTTPTPANPGASAVTPQSPIAITTPSSPQSASASPTNPSTMDH